jgi:nuclear protein localization family protein 4
VDEFITAWRKTGVQRFGFMFGKYEPYEKVPLGIKAVVCAIYEPNQHDFVDGIQVDVGDTNVPSVDALASQLGLHRIGMIYTDLLDAGQGKVVCKRHSESYFLSSAECITSASFQHTFPVNCRYSSTGTFGSRFLTCVISGNETNDIDISCFQISNVGVAMARDGIIEASVDPALMRVKASSSTHYVPEVFYKYRNEYGIMVQEAAKPTFPVDYLLTTMTHGFPSNPNPVFKSSTMFPIENRPDFGTVDSSTLKKHLDSSDLIKALSDFHFLAHLQNSHILEKPDLELICKIVKENSFELLSELVARPTWQTFLVVLDAASSNVASNRTMNASKTNAAWACRHCTFMNTGADCEMCGLPKD